MPSLDSFIAPRALLAFALALTLVSVSAEAAPTIGTSSSAASAEAEGEKPGGLGPDRSGLEAELFGTPSESEEAPESFEAPDRSALSSELFGAPEAPESFEAPDRSALSSEQLGGVVTSTRPEGRFPADSSADLPPGGRREGLEAELFGPSPSERAEAPVGGGGEGLLGGLVDALDDASERLAIGGQLYLRLEVQAQDEEAPEGYDLVSPNTLDLYLDARPIDRVRTYVRGRLAYDPTFSGVEEDASDGLGSILGAQSTDLAGFLDQLWVKFDADHRVFFTVGKQRVRWGTGRVWNPTDFLNGQRFNPLALFDPRLGVGLIKVQVPFEDIGANLYAVANLEGAQTLDQIGVALRAEIALEQAEVAVSGSWRSGEPLRLGLDLSGGLGDFDLRAEAALLYDLQSPFLTGTWSGAEPLELSGVSARYRNDELIPQIVVGGDYTLDYGDGEQAILGLEYFYNDTGYDSAELYPLLALAPNLYQIQNLGLADLGFTSEPPTLLQPLYLGRHYLSAFVLLPQPFGAEDWFTTFTGIVNLSDGSAVLRVDQSVQLFRFLTLRAYGNVHLGNEGELRLGVDVASIPLLLPDGISSAPPLFELGLALSTTL